ncbi:MAG: hypothetical protein ABFR47_06470, partial [Verrucomicrobiota bacterium]
MCNKGKALIFAAVMGVAGVLHADTIDHGGTIVSMDFASIANLNSVSDSSGYGAVGYAYRMGKYEVTASQWATVIAADSRV